MYFGFIGIALFIGTIAYAGKVKNNRLFVGAILGISLFMLYFSQVRNVKEIGNQVRVENSFGGYAHLRKTKKIKDHVYLVVGPVMRPWGISGYSTDIPVIAMGDVEKLNREFGDFRKCSSSGAKAAMASMVELKLVNADPAILSQIKLAFSEAIKSNENVFIRLDGHAMELIENKLKGRVPDRDLSSPPRENIFATNLQFFINSVK